MNTQTIPARRLFHSALNIDVHFDRANANQAISPDISPDVSPKKPVQFNALRATIKPQSTGQRIRQIAFAARRAEETIQFFKRWNLNVRRAAHPFLGRWLILYANLKIGPVRDQQSGFLPADLPAGQYGDGTRRA